MYRTCRAAKWLGVAPWELQQQGSEWRDAAVMFERAEGRAEEIRQRQAEQAAKRNSRRG